MIVTIVVTIVVTGQAGHGSTMSGDESPEGPCGLLVENAPKAAELCPREPYILEREHMRSWCQPRANPQGNGEGCRQYGATA